MSMKSWASICCDSMDICLLLHLAVEPDPAISLICLALWGRVRQISKEDCLMVLLEFKDSQCGEIRFTFHVLDKTIWLNVY